MTIAMCAVSTTVTVTPQARCMRPLCVRFQEAAREAVQNSDLDMIQTPCTVHTNLAASASIFHPYNLKDKTQVKR